MIRARIKAVKELAVTGDYSIVVVVSRQHIHETVDESVKERELREMKNLRIGPCIITQDQGEVTE